MRVRLYQPEDETAVREIFRRQEIDADLPLPWIDPAVMVAAVAEDDDGTITDAIIGRITIEAHLVSDPEKPGAVTRVRKLANYTEGAALAIAQAMREKKCAIVTDIIAFVPKGYKRMEEFMSILGYVEEPPSYQPWWKRLGE
jgi:hypothetical protein